jgi:hypothetical protein
MVLHVLALKPNVAPQLFALLVLSNVQPAHV